jgi:hypothetical protein
MTRLYGLHGDIRSLFEQGTLQGKSRGLAGNFLSRAGCLESIAERSIRGRITLGAAATRQIESVTDSNTLVTIGAIFELPFQSDPWEVQ